MDLPARLGGHRLLHRAGIVRPRERFVRREVYDYGHVVHDLQLNAWVLAYRRAAGDAFLSWDGETHIEPPREARVQQGVLRVGDHWSAEGLRDPRARLVRPDAVLEVGRPDGDGSRVLFIEYDRTRRVDKNYEKFRRYDTFLCCGGSTRASRTAMLARLTPEFEMTVPAGMGVQPQTYRGPEGFRRWFDSFSEIMEIRVESHDFIAVGDRVVAPHTLHARGRETGIDSERTRRTCGTSVTARRSCLRCSRRSTRRLRRYNRPHPHVDTAPLPLRARGAVARLAVICSGRSGWGRAEVVMLATAAVRGR